MFKTIRKWYYRNAINGMCEQLLTARDSLHIELIKADIRMFRAKLNKLL
jgi:hypothetical protein